MKKVKLNQELIKRLDIVFDRNWARLSEDVDIPRSTLYRVKDKPSGIDMQQLLAIANGLKIPVSKFFYDGRTHMIEQCDEYVAEPFLPCRYEYETLRNIVENRRGITWVKAYDIIGITQDNLKNSLLQDKAPVVRFLDFCDAFGIDPFTIIIDPNPKQKAKRRTATQPMLAEIAAMREEIGRLNAAVSELMSKYQDITDKYDSTQSKYASLLDAHEILLRRFNDHVNEVYIGMAADDAPAG